MGSFNILIVEDEVIIAETLQRELRNLGYPDSQRCKNSKEAKELLESNHFDLAILDINLSGGHEGIALAEICGELDIPFFFLTSYSDRATIEQAKNTRPGHYLIKPFSSEEIIVAIELTLMHHEPENDGKIKKAAQAFQLSERETDILKFVAQRLSNQEIGEKLFLSLNTVKYHLRHIYTKMGASSKQEIAERIEEAWSQEP